MAKKTITGAYDALPKIAKIIIQIFLGAVVGGIYRILRYLEKKNTTTLVAALLTLIPFVGFLLTIVDIITEITQNKVVYFAD